jgi:hypothetical protein
MAYNAQSRDRFKTLAALLTGVTTLAGVGVAGAATGMAARQTALGDQVGQQTPVQARPQRTVVHTRVVHRVSRHGVTAVGPGGRVTVPPPAAAGTGGSGPPAAQTHPQPPAAPTSGS